QRPHWGVEQLTRVEQLAELGDAAAQRSLVDAVDGSQHPERLPGGQLEPELRALPEQCADPPGQGSSLPPRGHAEDLRRSGRREQDSGEHLDRRRLAGAVRADEGDPLPFVDRERDGAHRLDPATATPPPALEHLREAVGDDAHRAWALHPAMLPSDPAGRLGFSASPRGRRGQARAITDSHACTGSVLIVISRGAGSIDSTRQPSAKLEWISAWVTRRGPQSPGWRSLKHSM